MPCFKSDEGSVEILYAALEKRGSHVCYAHLDLDALWAGLAKMQRSVARHVIDDHKAWNKRHGGAGH